MDKNYLICPHCDLDLQPEARSMYYQVKADRFEMGCPWCNRAVTVRLDPDGELRADQK